MARKRDPEASLQDREHKLLKKRQDREQKLEVRQDLQEMRDREAQQDREEIVLLLEAMLDELPETDQTLLNALDAISDSLEANVGRWNSELDLIEEDMSRRMAPPAGR